MSKALWKFILMYTVFLLFTVLTPALVCAQGGYAANNPQGLYDNAQIAKRSSNQVTLKALLTRMHKRYQFHFVYNDQEIKDLKVSASLLKTDESDLINTIREYLKTKGLQLSKLDTYQFAITLSEEKENPSMTKVSKTSQQPNQIHLNGIVKDKLGKPLVGVTVKIKGKSEGTVTDEKGSFLLDVSPEDSLVISYIGYQSKTIRVGNNTELEITLLPNEKSLNEVVVIGFGAERKKDLTGSLAVIDQDEIKNQPVNSVGKSLVGKIAGVNISQPSGIPGGGISVNIRGLGSIGAGNQPLYVVDGIPYSSDNNQNFNPMSFINPNDIESISVLKDASSTAIYGSRGANGVILITTKKGIPGRTSVNFSANIGVQNVPIKGRPQMMNKREFAELQRDKIDIAIRQNENREAKETDYPEAYRNPENIKGRGTDWYDLILRNALRQNYNLSVLKSTEASNLNFSLGYSDQAGVIRNTNFKRYNALFKYNTHVGSKINIGGNLRVVDINQKRTNTNAGRNTPLGVSIWGNPFPTPYDDNGNLKPFIESPKNKYHEAWSFPNPLFELKNAPEKDDRIQNVGSAFIEWDIIPGLKGKSSFGIKQTSANSSKYTPSTVGGNNKKPKPHTGKSNNGRGKYATPQCLDR